MVRYYCNNCGSINSVQKVNDTIRVIVVVVVAAVVVRLVGSGW